MSDVPASSSRSGCATAALALGALLHVAGTAIFVDGGAWDWALAGVLIALILAALALNGTPRDTPGRLPRSLLAGFGMVGYPVGLLALYAAMMSAAYRGMG